MTCKYYEYCHVNCDGIDEKVENCECHRLHEHIDMLVDAINQGTKKFHNGEADFLHEAMSKHFEFVTGMDLDKLLEECD